ncbi:hypothetical protein SPRG_01062 [Saprolegnia parasitica CBS 223.65]|uniref:Uncharacterized protein n=1 Tax=Saprolegnia parasitica (strain CBS 223.65) TaxID=695850 RepID=A0A067CWB3_SAPPC|nr:hypothetical protein SPRG_01062 [Saprolegnia parasitica CBS 223.65]KDO34999.1 hypothetical protein SPRG_01062 [Saprolegnia parasitica CBS 223.65]|eukprot:XP_012194652.1 hypothetical protein SPRG_01062 [Saprolegnia parasitica CBS 223.65]
MSTLEAGTSEPSIEDELLLLSDERQRDFSTLTELVKKSCTAVFSQRLLFMTFKDASYSVADAFQRISKRDEAKKRTRNGDDFGASKRQKNSRMSLPAYVTTGSLWSPPIAEEAEYSDAYFGVASSAPPRLDSDRLGFLIKNEVGVPLSQSKASQRDDDDDDVMDVTYMSDLPERNEADCFNHLSSYCLKLREPKPEASAGTPTVEQTRSLQQMFTTLVAVTTDETLALTEAACAAYNAAEACNTNDFDRADELVLLQDIVMALPHADDLDRLRKVVRPTEDRIADLESTVQMTLSAHPSDCETNVAVLHAVCLAYATRMRAFVTAKEDLMRLHAAVYKDFTHLGERIAAKMATSATGVANADEMLQDKQAAEESAAAAVQALVEAARLKAEASGVTASAAVIRAQRSVFADEANTEAVAALAAQASAELDTGAALKLWRAARDFHAFYEAAKALLDHVESARLKTMDAAVTALATEAQSASRMGLEKLQGTLPVLCKELAHLETTLDQRAKHATRELHCQKVKLETHTRHLGNMVKLRRQEVLDMMAEFEEVVVLCSKGLATAANQQRALWAMLKDLVPKASLEALVRACRPQLAPLKSPLRHVFADFAHIPASPVAVRHNASPSLLQAPAAQAPPSSLQAPVAQAPPAPEVIIRPDAPTSPRSQDLVVPPPKFKVGDHVFAKFASGSGALYAPAQVIGVLPSRVYLLVFADGDQYSLDELFLFSPAEHDQIQVAASADAPARGGCALM